MSAVVPDPVEEEALYALLKPREADLPIVLGRFLNRLEKNLYLRLTVEQIEKLAGETSRRGKALK
jgi:hypothetical protein